MTAISELVWPDSGLDGLALLFAQTFHSQPYAPSGPQADGFRLDAHADSRWRPGGDEVAWLQAHKLGEVRDDMLHRKDHGLGGAILIAMPIDLQPEPQVLRIRDLIAGHQVGADGAEGVMALALHPLSATLRLKFPLGNIVHDAVAGHIVERLFFRDVLGLLADDEGQFDLPVGLARVARNLDGIVRPDDATRRLHENHGLAGYREIRFRSVVE